MFRKFCHIIIALLLLTATIGFSVSKHYCGSRLVSISVDHQEKSCCDMDGCCHNETKVFQLQEEILLSQLLENNAVNSIDLLFPIFYLLTDNNLFENSIITFQIFDSPPPIKTQTRLSNLQTYLC